MVKVAESILKTIDADTKVITENYYDLRGKDYKREPFDDYVDWLISRLADYEIFYLKAKELNGLDTVLDLGHFIS